MLHAVSDKKKTKKKEKIKNISEEEEEEEKKEEEKKKDAKLVDWCHGRGGRILLEVETSSRGRTLQRVSFRFARDDLRSSARSVRESTLSEEERVSCTDWDRIERISVYIRDGNLSR